MQDKEDKYLKKWIKYVESNFDHWSDYAAYKEVSATYVHYVKTGKSKITNYLLADIGIERLWIFKSIEGRRYCADDKDGRIKMAKIAKKWIKDNYETHTNYAKEKNMSVQHLSKITNAIRLISEDILADIGYERIEIFRKIK